MFRSLTVEEIREIVDLKLKRVRDQLKAQGMSLEVTQAAKDHLIKLGWDPAFGARPLRRTIQNLIEDVLAEHLLLGRYPTRATRSWWTGTRTARPRHPAAERRRPPSKSSASGRQARAWRGPRAGSSARRAAPDFLRWEGQCRSCGVEHARRDGRP